jgi:hypothetical protein
MANFSMRGARLPDLALSVLSHAGLKEALIDHGKPEIVDTGTRRVRNLC